MVASVHKRKKAARRGAPIGRSPALAPHPSDVLIALSLALLAVVAGAPLTPVVLLVALAVGVWRPPA